MKIGCLGDIVFEVSENVIKTFKDSNWNGSAQIHAHNRHLTNALQEFVGVDPDEFSFTITISKYLGADPIEDISKIFNYERNGIAVPLVIGKKAYGKYLWLIKNHKSKLTRHDGAGNVVSADVTISLTEYTEG